MSNYKRLRDQALEDFTPQERADFERLSERVELGEQLRAARLTAGMPQAALAAASGVPQPELSKIENGQVEPSYSRLRKIIRATGGDVPVVQPGAVAAKPRD